MKTKQRPNEERDHEADYEDKIEQLMFKFDCSEQEAKEIYKEWKHENQIR